MIKVLGIDCSSSTIGWALLGVDGYEIKLLEHGHIKPPKKDKCSLIERLDIVSSDIKVLCDRLKPDHSVVEDIIQFMPRRSSATTIIMLAVFNRAVSLQLYRSISKVPLFLLPVSIRSRISKFLGITKIDKEDIPKILQDYFGKAFFTIEYKAKGKNKGKPIITVFDEADACAAAWAGIIDMKLTAKSVK